MLKSLKTMLMVGVLFVASLGSASAAFNISVVSTGGPGFAPFSSSSTVGAVNVLGGPAFGFPGLTVNYSITNTAPALGFFNLDLMNLVYQGDPAARSLQITITEDAANFFGSGAGLNGFSTFNHGGDAASSFSHSATFTPGTGANSVSQPLTNFSAGATPLDLQTTFTSNAATGTISAVFNINLAPNANVNFLSGGGLGAIGVSQGLVPAPPALLMGFFGVPALALLRRFRK